MIQSSLRQFGIDLRQLDTQTTYSVYHYWRPMMKAPFIVWAETGEADDFHADNGKAEIILSVTIDIYTQTEFDELLDKVFEYLDGKKIPFTLDSVDFEEDTRLIHYSFTCEMAVVTSGET